MIWVSACTVFVTSRSLSRQCYGKGELPVVAGCYVEGAMVEPIGVTHTQAVTVTTCVCFTLSYGKFTWQNLRLQLNP